MTFPHAAKGINKIFTAEILALIAFVFSGIATVGAVITANILANDSNADIAAAAIVLLVFGIIAGVLAIVSVIIKFIGIFNASRDERAFKSVIYLTLINLGVAILAACFSGIPFFNNLSNIVSLLIILGIGKLALQLNNPEIIQKCGTLFRLILWIGLLSLFMRFFSIFLPSQAAYVIILILSILSIVLSVVQYILYLLLLVKALAPVSQIC